MYVHYDIGGSAGEKGHKCLLVKEGENIKLFYTT